MSSEAPKSEQIQANVAAALSRLRGDLSTSSVASAVVTLGVPAPEPAPAPETAPADPLQAGMPEMPGSPVDGGLQADPAMATHVSGEPRMRAPEAEKTSPLQRIAGLRIEQPDLLAPVEHTPPPLPDLADADPVAATAARRLRNRLILGGGVAAVVLIGAVWILMSGGGEEAGGPPVITADATPEKVKPEDEGGMQVPNLNTTILDQTQPQQGETVMPPPETPVAPPAPVVTDTAPAAPDVPAVAAPAAPEVPSVAAPDSAAAPAPAAPEPAAAAPAPAATPAPEPAAAPAPVVQATAPEPAATQTASAPASTPVSVPAGSIRIQFAAVKSEAAAQDVWSQLQKRYPAVLGGLGLNVEKVDKAGSVLYRVQAGPFSDRAAAKQACAKLKAQNQDCIVAR